MIVLDQPTTNRFIQLFDCFNVLDFEDQKKVEASIKMYSVDQSETIFKGGDICKEVFFLVKGSIKIFTYDPLNQKEHIASIEHPTSIFGECCLYGSEYKEFSAMSIEDNTTYFAINIDLIKDLMSRNLDFSLGLLRIIGEKTRKNNERLTYFATRDARARVIEFLKQNAEEVGTKVGYETLVKHGLTQSDIATYTGTSRQTVTTVLNDLKKSNQIYLRRKSILIRDLASLN